MMDLPVPAPVYCNVIEVACEQDRVGPLLKLAYPEFSVEAELPQLALDDTLLPPVDSFLKVKTGIVDQAASV